MKETKFLATFLPSQFGILTLIHEIRNTYKIPEISPDDVPITEIYRSRVRVS